MKTKNIITLLAALLSVAFTIALHAQTSAFTYQGRLLDGTGGEDANGLRTEMQEIMTARVGIFRTGAALQAAEKPNSMRASPHTISSTTRSMWQRSGRR